MEKLDDKFMEIWNSASEEKRFEMLKDIGISRDDVARKWAKRQ